MKVLNFGSLNIDYVYSVDHFVKKGETISSNSLNVYSGGKGLNQSIATARAGVDVTHAGNIGEDGKFLLDLLSESGVNTDHILVRKDVPTGNAIIQNDKEGDNCIILYGGANLSMEEEYIDQVLEQYNSGDFLILQNEINNVDYIVNKAHNKGMVIFLNPSPMNKKIWEIPLDKIDYFFVNEIEAAELARTNEDNEIIILQLLNKKYPNAKFIMTLGAKGSIFYDGKDMIRQGTGNVKVVDTTAAGDTFTGYVVSGIAKGLSMEETMSIAASASDITVSRKGAAPSIPYISEILKTQ